MHALEPWTCAQDKDPWWMKLRHKFFADALNDVAAGVSALNKTAAARGESNKGTIELQNMKQLTQALPEYTCGPWQLVCSLGIRV